MSEFTGPDGKTWTVDDVLYVRNGDGNERIIHRYTDAFPAAVISASDVAPARQIIRSADA